MICSTDGCQKPVRARGLCATHYASARRTGSIGLVLPRRENNLCKTCGERDRMHGSSSYCRKCATEYQKSRYAADPRIMQRQKELYDPVHARGWRLKNKYGLTTESYEAMLAAQGGACAICSSVSDLHVDHDHSCCPGEKSCGACVRGLLCSSCNNGLGRFKDNVKNLERAVEYLNIQAKRQAGLE